ncbi:nucleotide exchange factor GrpE [Noviherbaspirillum sp. CPCC 100848]|uniref:Protein GrpE n=1 Tax=Noviherbaspirillum album TaxID=3080276 RepID=A0ABU6J9G1_9BURK|nr:nucleotide exchange factor GrpE [Noviherbaspirillum sp. CPCC 100848]MEC4720290.1 nucleotide exchange factor GrpE [Noviherbaspirillum sp. CPCC 100848]
MQDQEKMHEQTEQANQAAQNPQAAQTSEAPASDNGASQAQAAASPQQNASLEEKLAATEAKLAELQDAFLRAKADTENIRRRAQEDIAKAHKFAIENFAEALVPVKDSLEMALKLETPAVESLKEGVEMTLKQLSAAFERNRLIEINPVAGEKLDPMKHQAISMVPAEQDANTIVSVLQKGYTIADRLLRPALVTVAQ